VADILPPDCGQSHAVIQGLFERETQVVKRILLMLVTMSEALRRSRTLVGRTAVLSRGLLPTLMSVGALIGLTAAASSAADENRCLGMLGGAPEGIRRLAAVHACRGADAGCGYVQLTPGYAVLTLICARSGVQQIVFADRLSMLQLRDGMLVGECRTGSWQRDAGLPGCYPGRSEARAH